MKTRIGKTGDRGWLSRNDLESRGTPPPSLAATGCDVSQRGHIRALPRLLLWFLLLHSSFCLQALGQSYSIDWHKIAGGGATSTNGRFFLSGTIGQPDASGALSGGTYSVTGGYWSMLSVVQSAGLPNLLIVPNGPNSVKVLWPNTGSYTLQQNASVASPGGWTTSGYSISTSNGTNSITITPPIGNLFFRLSNP